MCSRSVESTSCPSVLLLLSSMSAFIMHTNHLRCADELVIELAIELSGELGLR